jgi:hypothetical protein
VRAKSSWPPTPMIKIKSSETNWEPIKKELRQKAGLILAEKELQVDKFDVSIIMPEEYRPKDYPGAMGQHRSYLRAIMLIPGFPGDITLLHIKDFPIKGALGWFNYVNGQPFIQVYGDHLRKGSRTGEFEYAVSETIVHEFCHKFYRKMGLPDRTHYWHFEENKLMGAVMEINVAKMQKMSLPEWIISMFRKLLAGEHETEVIKPPPNKIVIHHEGASNGFQAVNEWHKQRWNFKSELGFYIGYHYYIEKDGKVFQGRADTEDGAHTSGHNQQSIGICLMGNFETEIPTKAQLDALESLVKDKKKQYNISKIYGHRQLGNTLCPGKNLFGWVEKLA